MAYNASLEIFGKTYGVLECEYEFVQAVDITGRPSDRPRGGLISLVIQSPAGSDLSFYEWMRDKDTTEDGKIFFKINDKAQFADKVLEFRNAYCVRLYEYFNSNNSMPMYMKLGIQAELITIGADNCQGCEFQMID